MTKVNSEDLIQFQRGELSKEKLIIVENELSRIKTSTRVRNAEKADFAMESHFNNYKMPKDFEQKVKKI